MLRAAQVGGRGGGPLLGTAAQIWVFFLNEPSLRYVIFFYFYHVHLATPTD